MERISKHDYYLNIAAEVARRGTCLRRNYGAVIVKDDRIISTGYTGAPSNAVNCCDKGVCYRQEHDIPSGERYELCRSVHAEMNAIIMASKEELKGAVLYLAGWQMENGEFSRLLEHAEPCLLCKRIIINAGITEVIARDSGNAKSGLSIQVPGLWLGLEQI